MRHSGNDDLHEVYVHRICVSNTHSISGGKALGVFQRLFSSLRQTNFPRQASFTPSRNDCKLVRKNFAADYRPKPNGTPNPTTDANQTGTRMSVQSFNLRVSFSSQLCKLSFPSQAAGSAVSVSFHQFRTYAYKRKMPPKKEVKQEKILLGRPGNNLKSGIVCTTT
jgi:hypothetical protein